MNSSSPCEPAASVVAALGGTVQVAHLVGRHVTRVSNWMRPRAKGGTGGRIPMDLHRKLIRIAQARGVDLTAEMMLPPDDEDET